MLIKVFNATNWHFISSGAIKFFFLVQNEIPTTVISLMTPD